MKSAFITAVVPVLLVASACTSGSTASSALTSLDPLPARRLSEQFENPPDEYIVHIRDVGFVHRGTASSIGLPGSPDGFDFDLPEDTVTDTWLLIGPEQPLNVIGLTRDSGGVFLVRMSIDELDSRQEHVPTGRSASSEVSGENNQSDFAGELPGALLIEATRIRAGVEGGTFWTRPAEESDRLLVGEPSDGCGRNNERWPDTSRVQEVRADDFTPTGVSMCVAGASAEEALLERTETGFEILSTDEWDAVRAFVLGPNP